MDWDIPIIDALLKGLIADGIADHAPVYVSGIKVEPGAVYLRRREVKGKMRTFRVTVTMDRE
jgi:hypothetical protein